MRFDQPYSNHVMGYDSIAKILAAPSLSSRPDFVKTFRPQLRSAKPRTVSHPLALTLLHHGGVSGRLHKRTNTAVSNCTGVRFISWSPRPNQRPVEFNDLSDGQEEAAKTAILEKVMKGRQPTDLMLRCE